MNDVVGGRMMLCISEQHFIFACMEWLKNILKIAVWKANIHFDIQSWHFTKKYPALVVSSLNKYRYENISTRVFTELILPYRFFLLVFTLKNIMQEK